MDWDYEEYQKLLNETFPEYDAFELLTGKVVETKPKYYTCECGSILSIARKQVHYRRNRHIQTMRHEEGIKKKEINKIK